MEICRAAEQTEHQVRQLMEKTKTLEINEIKSKQPKQTFNKRFEHRRYGHGNEVRKDRASAADVQTWKRKVFKEIPGVKIYIDDLIIHAKTEKEHDNILEQVLNRAREKGVKFNKQKCKFKVSEIKYVGHILTEQGIKADNDKIEAIQKITSPNNVKDLNALSRTGIDNKNFELLIDEIEAHTNLLLDSNIISKQQMQNFQEKTDKDPELVLIKELIKHGWPKEKKSLNPIAKPYWKYKTELGIKTERFRKLHYGHMGVDKTVNKAREVLFWPGYINEIKTKIQSCATCQKFQNSNPNEPLINRKLPSRPWEAIAADFFHFDEKEYLLIFR
ncbi:Integrase zinc binding domain [Popillia japonica]|uniref:RNA-directed DNA polymerase n=1 Tax=Popillia japonica TaxID=7064 RepID=A0AAW1LCU4_POPJA